MPLRALEPESSARVMSHPVGCVDGKFNPNIHNPTVLSRTLRGVIEHDIDVMQEVDYIVDIGPGSGKMAEKS